MGSGGMRNRRKLYKYLSSKWRSDKPPEPIKDFHPGRKDSAQLFSGYLFNSLSVMVLSGEYLRLRG